MMATWHGALGTPNLCDIRPAAPHVRLSSGVACILLLAFSNCLIHLFLRLDDVAQVEDWETREWEIHNVDNHTQKQVPAEHVCHEETSTGSDETCSGDVRSALGGVKECSCRETKASCGTNEDEHEDQVGTQGAQQEDQRQDAQSDGIVTYALVSTEEGIDRLVNLVPKLAANAGVALSGSPPE